jgi:hypothetical protein
MPLVYRSIISGILSYGAIALPRLLAGRYAVSDDVFFLFPGLLFAVFILLPLPGYAAHGVIRRTCLLICSVAAWYVAVSIGIQFLPMARQSTVWTCGVSGGVGVSILAMASRTLIPIHIGGRSFLTALGVAFFGGCLIGLAVIQPRTSLAGEGLYLIGFVFWQTGVAMSLFRKAAAPKEPGGPR